MNRFLPAFYQLVECLWIILHRKGVIPHTHYFVLFPLVPLLGVMALGYVFVNAIARPSLMAALASVPDEVRGTVLGLNVTSAAFGWLGAASLGGWMMAQYGFAGFGPSADASKMGFSLGGALQAINMAPRLYDKDR